MTSPPLWLLNYCRQLRRDGIDMIEAGARIYPELSRRVRDGDLEAAYWQMIDYDCEGLQTVMSVWRE